MRLIAFFQMIVLAVVQAPAAERPAMARPLTTLAPLSATYKDMTGDALFERLVQSNQARDGRLRQYSAVRSYKVTSDTGKVYAEQIVRMDYQAPDHKSFRTISEEGSGLVRSLVLKRLIESESETSSGTAHRDSSIRPANYQFRPIGEQDVGPYHCLVAEATPRRKDKYLFEGRVWIDVQDYAIVRIAGHPAKSLSFWITRADFVREYQKLDNFWVPAKDETSVHVRLYGNKILTIDHNNYVINQTNSAGGVAVSGDELTATGHEGI